MTDIIHGPNATTEAMRASEILFGGDLAGIPERTFNEIVGEVPTKAVERAQLDGAGRPLVELLVHSGLCPSKRQARKDIEGGVDPEEELHVTIGRNVRDARKRAGLTLKQLSNRTALSVSLLSQIDRQRSFRAAANPRPRPDESQTAGTSSSKDPCYEQLVDALNTVLRNSDLAMICMDEGVAGPGTPGTCRSESAVHEGMSDCDIAALDRLRKGEPWISVPGQADRDTLSAPGARTTYYFPIIVNGRIDRVLKVRGGDLPEDVCSMTSTFCRQTGLSIENLASASSRPKSTAVALVWNPATASISSRTVAR